MAFENLTEFTVAAESRHPKRYFSEEIATTPDMFSDAYNPKTHRYNQDYINARSGWGVACDATAPLIPDISFLSKPDKDIKGIVDLSKFEDILDPGELEPPPIPPGTPVVVPDEIVSYRWSYQQISGGNQSESVLKDRNESPFNIDPLEMARHKFNVPSEGRYNFRLEIQLSDGNLLTSERNLRIRDRLVVSIGDSYASGEGLPDVRGTTDNLSDFANQILGSLGNIPVLGGFFDKLNIINSGDEFCEQATIAKIIISLIPAIVELSNMTVSQILTIGTGDEVAEILQELFEWSSEKTRGIGVNWQESFAHRSYFSGPSMAAQELETLENGDVVTFLSFARSGSTITKGLINSRREDSTWNPIGQIDEIKETVRDRQIDALHISIGGNDAGFARSLTYLTIGDGLRFWGYAIGNVGVLGANIPTIFPSTEEIKAAAIEKITEELPNCFNDLEDEIADLGIPPDRIYLTGYPESLFDDPRSNSGVNGECGIFSGHGLSIDTEDALAIKEVAQKLNEELQSIANRLGWKFIDGIADGFAGKGYCSDQSFYVFAEDSCRLQGDFNGMMHPNRDGAKVYSNRIADTLRPVLFPREFDLGSADVPQPGGGAIGGSTLSPTVESDSDSAT